MSTGTSSSIPQSVPALAPDEMPDYDQLVAEDGKPVDSIYSERQMRLLCDALYSSWRPDRSFVALANVGLFFSMKEPPIVPDILLSLDVQPPEDLWAKRGRSYFIWEFGKPPDAVFEVVSNTEGDELGSKRHRYAGLGIGYYIVWDPREYLKAGPLHVFVLHGRAYSPLPGMELPEVGLSLTRWRGVYEGIEAEWLRWCDGNGTPLPTGPEGIAQQRERAEKERGLANKERERADRLAAQLRALGINPDDPS
jgi:Uma2 family endonuclease